MGERGYIPFGTKVSDLLSDWSSVLTAVVAGTAPPATLGAIAVAPYHHRHERRMVKGQLTNEPDAASLLMSGRLVGTCPCDATLSDGLTDGWTLARAPMGWRRA